MVLLALAVLIGFGAARVRDPLGARTARAHFTWLPALAVGAALNLAAFALDGTPATLAMGASLVVLLGFVASNAHLTGIVVIGVGLLLNLVAVVVNDGMPVRGSALVAAGVVDEHELATVELTGARHLERDSDLLPVLGDVIPVALPLAPEVLSFGDLIVVFGAGDAVRDLARRRRRLWSEEERAAFADALAAGAAISPLPTEDGRWTDLSGLGGAGLDGVGNDIGDGPDPGSPHRRPGRRGLLVAGSSSAR